MYRLARIFVFVVISALMFASAGCGGGGETSNEQEATEASSKSANLARACPET